FYQWCMGFDQPFMHLREMAVHFLLVVFTVALYAVAFRFVTGQKSKPAHWFLLLLLVCPLLFWAARFNWSICGASLPLLVFSTCVLLRENYKKLSVTQNVAFPLLWSV